MSAYRSKEGTLLVPLTALRQTQPLLYLQPETVARYVDRMKKDDKIDPIEVSDDGSGVYTVWQGHHRLAASGRCSFTHIPVIIHAKLITRR
jgi:hypothetical protein